MNNNDLVSIIMPVHNDAAYLAEVMNSIEKQTYKSFEIIAVDDASTDNSLEILNRYKGKLPMKVLVNSENLGVAISRNKAIDIANGRYIAFIDADDVWSYKKLQNQLNFMTSNNYSFTYTAYSYLKKGKMIPLSGFKKSLTYNQSLKNTIILTSTVMIDLNVIDKKNIKMPDIKRGQDTATWWHILKIKNMIAHGLNENLTLYRRGARTLSSNKIIALKRTWTLYRKIEKFSVLKSLYYFSFYIISASIRRISFKRKERENNF